MTRTGAAVLLVVAAQVAAPAAAYPRPGVTERVSVAIDGTEANQDSGPPAISADGRYVAFHSSASNLVPGDTNGRADVFVHDRQTGVTERVSVATDGTEGSAGSLSPAISGDGRYVAFESAASNLVPDDTNGTWDVFVHDRKTGETERVSVASDGTEGTVPPEERNLGTQGQSQSASISADGRYVAFHSVASNLVAGDTNTASDVFVHDRQTGTTERVSVASDGAQGNGGSYYPSLSADGRQVAFWSAASNLVSGDSNDLTDVFVHDRQIGVTEMVSLRTDGAQGNGHSYTAALSGDGRTVAFESWASNLVPSDTNDAPDVFVHDRDTGVTERVSVGTDGLEGNNYSFRPSVSADGRHVAFYSLSSTLVRGDTSQNPEVFVRDRATGVTERVSVGIAGAEADGNSSSPSITPDGRHVAFRSDASNLVPGVTNGQWDVFAFDRGDPVGVGGLAVARDGDQVAVSGWARFSGAVVTSATHPPGDAAPGVEAAGAELVGASVTYRPEEEDLLVRLRLASLPGEAFQDCVRLPTFPPFTVCDGASTGAGAPAVMYGLGFDVGGSSYEVRAVRAAGTAVPPDAGQHFALYECALVCTEGARLTGGIGTTGAEVSVSVPLGAVGAAPGAELTGVEAWTALGEATPGSVVVLGELALPDAAVPLPQVDLGVAPASVPQADVPFTTQAELAEGRFAGTLDVSELPAGAQRVWARTCLADTCGIHSVEVAQ